MGTLHATLTKPAEGLTAEVAWVVATDHQGRGYAREAAKAMVVWLREQGAVVVAHVRPPDHDASQPLHGRAG